jgi:hypothetical protein
MLFQMFQLWVQSLVLNVMLFVFPPSVFLPKGSIRPSWFDISSPREHFATDPKVGVFCKICKLNNSLHDKDRIEIYRKLIADPKESRRKKVEMERKKAAQAKQKANTESNL